MLLALHVVALVPGWVVMVTAGATLVVFLVACACSYCWQTARQVHSLAWLQRAIRAHHKVEPMPGDQGEPLQW